MDASSLPPLLPGELRPVTALQSDLLAILREGRNLPGEVLQKFDGGTVLIGLGEHRVPAHARTDLEPGDRVRIEVQQGGAEPKLRIVEEGRPSESKFVQLLRAVVADVEPLARGLARLQAALQSVRASADPASEPLLTRLRAEGKAPPQGAPALRQRLVDSGFTTEARLARAAAQSALPRERAAWVEPLRLALTAALPKSAPQGSANGVPQGAPTFVHALVRQVQQQLAAPAQRAGTGPSAAPAPNAPAASTTGSSAPLSQAAANAPTASAAEVASAVQTLIESAAWKRSPQLLESLLQRAFEVFDSTPEGAERIAARRAFVRTLRSLRLGSLPEPLRAELLQSLLVAKNERGAATASLPGREPGAAAPSLAAPPEADLKIQLTQALEQLEEPAARDALRRALASLEAEQLLNLARSEVGEAQHWMLALPDGELWTTLHLYWQGGRGGGGRSSEGGRQRLSLGVELSGLGPIRVDLSLAAASGTGSPGRLDVHVAVTKAELAEQLQADAAELEEAMGSGGVSVSLRVRTVAAESLSQGDALLDLARRDGEGWLNMRG